MLILSCSHGDRWHLLALEAPIWPLAPCSSSCLSHVFVSHPRPSAGGFWGALSSPLLCCTLANEPEAVQCSESSLHITGMHQHSWWKCLYKSGFYLSLKVMILSNGHDFADERTFWKAFFSREYMHVLTLQLTNKLQRFCVRNCFWVSFRCKLVLYNHTH